MTGGGAGVDFASILRGSASLTSPAPLTAEERFLSDLASGFQEMAHAGGRMTFEEHIRRVNPTVLNFEHVPRVVDVLQRVRDGELKRVMILEPPRYLKTELASRLWPSYLLADIPNVKVGLASYGAELAWSISEEAREYYKAGGGKLRTSTSAKRRWRNVSGGEMWAAGSTGPIHGFGYQFGIVDDPQDPEKAWSLTYQKRFEEFWERKWLQRSEPGAAIVVVMQRLGPNDAIDYLLRREVGEDTDTAPEHWHVVLMDEIRSNQRVGSWDGPLGLPPTCTLEPDPRPFGAILAPSRFGAEEVAAKQKAAGTFTNATQRQQRPATPEGDFWRKEWFDGIAYDELPSDAYNLGWDWDLAYTKEERNSASAGVQSARGPGKAEECLIYIEDVVWDWLEYPELVAFMKARTGPHYIEAKASGKSAKQSLSREGIVAKEVSVSGDKLSRASSVQTVASNKRIRVKRSVLRILLQGDRQGLLNVRAEDLAMSKGDLDLNDAFVEALTRHVGKKGKTVRTAVPGQKATAAAASPVAIPAMANGNGNSNGKVTARVTARTIMSLDGEPD